MNLLSQTVLEQVQATERQVKVLHSLCKRAVETEGHEIYIMLDCENMLELLESISKQVSHHK